MPPTSVLAPKKIKSLLGLCAALQLGGIAFLSLRRPRGPAPPPQSAARGTSVPSMIDGGPPPPPPPPPPRVLLRPLDASSSSSSPRGSDDGKADSSTNDVFRGEPPAPTECRHKGKVFCVGLFKTGTSSCGRLLDDLGYPPSGKTRGFVFFHDALMWDDAAAAANYTVEYLSSNASGELGRELWKDLRETRSANDGPWLFMFEELRAAFPGSKFVYTARNLRDLINSDVEHFWIRTWQRRRGRNAGGKETRRDFDEIVRRKDREGDLDAISAQMAVVRRYGAHERRIRRTFGNDKGEGGGGGSSSEFLEVNFFSDASKDDAGGGDVRRKVERFLGCPPSGKGPPHVNAAAEGAAKRRVSDAYWDFLNTYEEYDFANITKPFGEPRHKVTGKTAHETWIASGRKTMDAGGGGTNASSSTIGRVERPPSSRRTTPPPPPPSRAVRPAFRTKPAPTECRHKGKVFCVGLFKTGTSSCGGLLDDLGYPPAGATRGFFYFHDELMWDDAAAASNYTVEYLSSNASEELGRELWKDLKETHSANDGPWLFMFEELRRAFPGSKFVYTTRNLRDLVDSDVEHFWIRTWQGKKNSGKDGKDFEEIVELKHREGRLDAISAQMAVVRRYGAHERRIRRTFGNDKGGNSLEFLEVNFFNASKKAGRDVRQKVERFLGCPPSGKELPHDNAAAEGATKRRVSDAYWDFLNTYEEYDFANITKPFGEPRHKVTGKTAHETWIASGRNVYG